MTAPAKVQAIETLIEAHAVELKLPTVRRRFRALAEEATRDQQTPADRRPVPAHETTGGVPLRR